FGGRIPLDWSIVETDLYVSHARQIGLTDPKFYLSIDEAAASGPFDFVLFSGVLQYLDDWRAPLTHPAVLRAKRVLISRIAVGDREIPFLQTVRTAAGLVQYPGRVMRHSDIVGALTPTHRQALAWDLDQHMGEIGVCPAPAILWERLA